ncbi:PEP-CTERM sorting domain-containing protein [Calothrix sp. FACHB-1219]|uniref:PEP-CTERM sorting domain-containing protein n=1 Tax=unclassified Calothrix TaxID=2619626 RepID=UPI0016883D54|nr:MULTISPECIES: PEP-CTERM sorting domain-containing protein [unclassified Calothrix]MBD2201122.1 PEP-CTERM sorting domain-containing protein [Calothrix sp. FACHB-168]MBD2215556.1 PEP-CTERM sorting domain-containing protein [Calothrix sp. FACHB-1219]
MNFKTIGVGIALTCGTLAVGSTLAPAQAASINGILNISGSGLFVNGPQATPSATDTIKFDPTDSRVTNSSTGTFAGYKGQNVLISDIALALNSFNPTATGSNAKYSGTASNAFIKFSDGLKFNIKNPFEVDKFSINDTAIGVIKDFTGTFVKNGSALGKGVFTVNQFEQDGSFSMTIKATNVPEPLTILGSVTALGMGVALKKKQVQNLAKKKVTA